MKVVKDLRILNAICRRYGIEFDKNYKYIWSDYDTNIIEYKGKKYKQKFFDGCFCQYLVELDDK